MQSPTLMPPNAARIGSNNNTRLASRAEQMQAQLNNARMAQQTGQSPNPALTQKLNEVAQRLGVEPNRLLLALLEVIVNILDPDAQSAGRQAVPDAPALQDLLNPAAGEGTTTGQTEQLPTSANSGAADAAGLGANSGLADGPIPPENAFDSRSANVDGAGTGAARGAGTAAGGANAASAADVQTLINLIRAGRLVIRPPTTGTAGPAGTTGTTGPTGTSPSGITGGGETNNASVIPRPQADVTTTTLGQTQITIGNDGSGNTNAADVQNLINTLQTMYQSSPTFRQSVDAAPNGQLEISLGKRPDNTSWGGNGRVFMNLNNISAQNSDPLQSLVAHEIAHAANNAQHGPELEAYEARVAAETPG